jgi:hypothetical protein
VGELYDHLTEKHPREAVDIDVDEKQWRGE